MKVRENSRRFNLGSVARSSLLIGVATVGLTLTKAGAAGTTSWDLDLFEAPIRVVQPLETSAKYRNLWNLYTDNDVVGSSVTDLVTSERHDGAQSLHNRFNQAIDGGLNWQFQFYPYTIGVPGLSPDGWQYMRSLILGPTAWNMGQVNRIRLWVKIPSTTPARFPGNFNFEFGTYLREIADPFQSAESNNWHFYHQMNLFGTGQWEQLIIDTHPSHQRSADPNAEQGDHLHPSTATPTNTYFDLMTRFYLDFPYTTWPTNPNDFYIDSVTPYVETALENVAQVYSVHGVYTPGMHQVRVGWSRPKNDEVTKHEVRYAFTNIQSTGWASAIAAPNGVITPPSSGGYNGMEWATTSIDLTGRSVIYVAIKPQNSSLFRQIAIPLTAVSPTVPAAPTNVTVTP